MKESMDFNEQTAFEMLNILRRGNALEKCRLLTYIHSNTDGFKAIEALTDTQYAELCQLIIISLTSNNQVLSSNAGITLNNILCTLKTHSLHFFQAALQIDRKDRLQIFQFLEDVEDNVLLTAMNDIMVIPFFHDCMCSIQSDVMKWITENISTDNFQILIEAENKELSDTELIEEKIIDYALNTLQRLYKLSSPIFSWDVHQFDAFIMNIVISLAYMGHKRQRRSAIRLLQQAIETDIGNNIRSNFLDIWQKYKTMLQSVYCKRIALLVEVSDPDWASLWNISVQLLGTDLHHGANLINNLLSVEEKAFKSTDTTIRRQAFGSWKILIDNFALDLQELATARRIKLLCIPLNAKNSKTELITITKFEVWWHLIVKLYEELRKFVGCVLIPFLNFAFGPLGDTPLLSHKSHLIASAGKRFLKTNVLAIDILLQLLTPKAKDCQIIAPTLTERLLHGITNSIFQKSYKSFIHSVGEALIIINDLSDMDVKTKQNIITALWDNLMHYVKELDMDSQTSAYNDIILIVMEIEDYVSNKQNIQSLLVNVIMSYVNGISTNFMFATDKFINFMSKLLTPEIFLKIDKKHHEAIKRLLWQSIKSNTLLTYKPDTLEIIKTIQDKMVSLTLETSNSVGVSELWYALADILSHYVADSQFHQGNVTEHAFAIIKSILIFPFSYIVLNDQTQILKLSILWNKLYREYNLQAHLLSTVKPNEIAFKISAMIIDCLTKNCNNYRFALYSLDAIMSTINYEYLSVEPRSSNIIVLMRDVCVIVLNENNEHEIEMALKALSYLLTNAHRHNSQNIVSYLEVITPVIDCMFSLSASDNIIKEITNTWKSIVSIFKGLNEQLTIQILAQYRDIIIKASCYTNSEIQSQTFMIFDYHDTLEKNTKIFLEELANEIKDSSTKLEFPFKKNEILMKKNIKMTGSFLNRKAASKFEIHNHQNNLRVNATAVASEPNTEEYVMIKPNFKFDVHRLTEHQLESLTRKRDNIPAMYNELSQSVSQDTQNLQEWFNNKIKEINETDKDPMVELDNSSERISINHGNNKENKIHAESLLVEDNDKLCSFKDKKPEDTNKFLDTTSNLTVVIHNDVTNFDSIKKESLTNNDSLNKNRESFNSLKSEKCIENKVTKLEIPGEKLNMDRDKEILLTNTNCNRRKDSVSHKFDTFSHVLRHRSETIVSESTQPCTQMFHRDQDKKSTIPSLNVKQISDKTNHRGIKRKAVSDGESEAPPQRKRRLTISSADIANDTNDTKSTKTDQRMTNKNLLSEMGLSQRTKNEISRLRINMVFDTLLTNRRRSKNNENNTNEEHASKNHIISGSAGLRGRTDDSEFRDSSKKYAGIMKKNSKIHNNQERIKKKGSNLKIDAPKEDSSTQVVEISVLPNSCMTKKMPEGSRRQQNIMMRDKVYPDANTTTLTKCPEVNDNILKDRQKKETNANNVIEARIISDTMHSADGSVHFLEVDEQIQTEMGSNTFSCSMTNEPMYDESEDIIECSQSNTDALLREKSSGFDRQCFIKINKIEEVQVGSSKENKSTDGSPSYFFNEINNHNFNINVTKNEREVQDNSQTLQDKEMMYSNLAKNIDLTDVKLGLVKSESAQGTSVMLPCNSSVNYVSPKNHCGRPSKKKTYTLRGRAAHMLGLVTKQALLTSNKESVQIGEDSGINKKLMSKDLDIGILSIKKDKLPIRKETEKNGSPSGSGRQEKIFNNMKSSDYCPLTSTNMLTNLNSDGEMSSKMETETSNVFPTKTNNVLNINETDVLQREKEELPMLEWSSANPPSLEASPSVSILKRHQQFIQDVDTDPSVSNKRKRVSFADPPVSMEMGYERSLSDSACKTKKLSILRNLNTKKESPVKIKQKKIENDQADQREINTDLEIPIELNSVRGFQTRSGNKFFTKIDNNLEDSDSVITNTKVESSCALHKSERNNVAITRLGVNTLASEVEISSEPKAPESETVTETLTMEKISFNMKIHTKKRRLEIEDVGTQQDLFDSIDTSNECSEVIEVETDEETKELINICSQSSALDSIDLNRYSTNDTDTFSNEFKSELLEDTIDAENLTELNLTEISDDIYCSKLIRTSTCAAESIGEQDTLPVTDSVFASLPLSQETQPETQSEIELIQPEFLDSIQPICPVLVVCQEPIATVVENLTNPLWVPYLSSYFTDRGLYTVGDLAQLTEREVNRIPVRGSPKVQFVRNVLYRFQNSSAALSQTLTNLSIQNLHLITPKNLAQSVTASKCLVPSTEPRYVKILPKVTASSIVSDLAKISINQLITPPKTSYEHVKAQDYYQVIQYVNVNIAAKAAFPEISTSHVGLCSQNIFTSAQHWVESRNNTLQSLSMSDKMSQTSETAQITSDVDTSITSVQSFLYTPTAKHYVKTTPTISITRSMCSVVPGITRSTQTSSYDYMQITSTIPTEFIHSICMTSNTSTSANLSQSIPTITTQPSGVTSTVNCAPAHLPCSTLFSASCSDLPRKSQNLISKRRPLITSIYTSTDRLFTGCTTAKATKCVATQISLVDLLDEIDVNLLVENTIRRCTPHKILEAYKVKMKHLPEHELVTETIKMLGIESNFNETMLEAACQLYGVNKLLMRLPHIFNADKQFFVQVLSAYQRKLQESNCHNALDFNEIKDTCCKCSCFEPLEALYNTLKTDKIQEITELVTDVSNLNTMVKRTQNNSSDTITKVLKSESSVVTQDVIDKVWDIDSVVSRITKNDMPRESLLKIYNAVSTKLSTRDLLDAFHDTMRSKLKNEDRTD